MTETVDAVVVEEPGTDVDLAPTDSLFRTDDPLEIISRATGVANALKEVIVAQKLFASIQGKSHITVEGWTLLGSMLGVTAVVTETETVDGGYKARVEARTTDGRVVGAAEALCTKHEKRGPWKTADDYARLSMAQTRATSKALRVPLGFVISLAGFSATPAEEMTFAEPDEQEAARVVAPSPTLDAKKVANLLAGVKTAGVSTDDLKLKLGALGVPMGKTAKATLERLTEAQAGEVFAWLNSKLDEAA